MSENDYFKASVKTQADANKLLQKLLSVTEHDHVFSAPIKEGDYTVITVAEVSAGMGFGYGLSGNDGAQQIDSEDPVVPPAGNGGGGGGGVSSRPVAVIEIGPSGVRVEPIFDMTKLGIALITALGSMFIALRRMRK